MFDVHAVGRHAPDGRGEVALLAAILARAADDAREGDVGARRWVIEGAPALLSWLAPAHADERMLHARYIRRAQPAGRPWFRRIAMRRTA